MTYGHDNYYETAITSISAGIKELGPDAQAQHQNPTVYYLARGLLLMAQGLLQESQDTEARLADLARRLPPAQ